MSHLYMESGTKKTYRYREQTGRYLPEAGDQGGGKDDQVLQISNLLELNNPWDVMYRMVTIVNNTVLYI